jgi:hypothetical protein
MRMDFFVEGFLTAAGERFMLLLPAEIPASFFFASSWDEKIRDLPLLTEEDFRHKLGDMGLSPDEVEYQLERARGLHLSAR